MVSEGKATAAMLGGEVSQRALHLGRTVETHLRAKSQRKASEAHASIFSGAAGAALEVQDARRHSEPEPWRFVKAISRQTH